jgi:xylulokinase
VSLVAGVDSSTQSCKVVIRDAASGELVRSGRAAHPDGTEVDPDRWWDAYREAVAQAGGLDDVVAVAVGAQQHGSVLLDADGEVVRPAFLWNDTRSGPATEHLTEALGGGERGRAAWADAVGSVLVPSFTVTKLRWVGEHEPDAVARTSAVCLPHDWLTWRLRGSTDPAELTTDRSDASGTGYWSPTTGEYRPDLVRLALGHDVLLPRVAGPAEQVGETATGAVLAPGAGDNAAAALGLGALPGDVIVSIGTSGTVFAVSEQATVDRSGTVAGFADATGRYLPLVATLNAARVIDAVASMLDVDRDEVARLALSAPAGAQGLVLVPYLEGERTPDRPRATGALHGIRGANATQANIARAAVEGMLCGLADGLDAVRALGVRVERVLLIGGGARSEAVRRIAPSVLGVPVVVPPPGEYVADGAARQAAWVLSGDPEPPTWTADAGETFDGPPVPEVRARYSEVRAMTVDRPL